MDEDQRSLLWLDYIGKLNERAINRRKASGSTSWAVAGAIAILVLKLLSGLPVVVASYESRLQHVIAVAGVCDILFSGALLFVLLLSVGNPAGEVRLQSRLDRARKPILMVVLFVASSLLFVANCVAVFHAPPWLSRWPFSFMACWILLNMAYPGVRRLMLLIRHRHDYSDIPEFASEIPVERKQRVAAYIALLTGALVTVGVASVPASQGLLHVTTGPKVDVVLWAAYLAAASLLAIFLCFRATSAPYEQFLGELERRIVVEELKPDAIRGEFVRMYLGEALRDWLTRAESKLGALYRIVETVSTSTSENFAEIGRMSPELTFEIAGRRKQACERFVQTYRAYVDYSKDLLKHLQRIMGVAARGDAALLGQIVDGLRMQLRALEGRHEQICEVCQRLTGSGRTDRCEEDERTALAAQSSETHAPSERS